MAFPGGGGYGAATKRPKEHVKRDLLLGYISADTAARDYGLSKDDIAAVLQAAKNGDESV